MEVERCRLLGWPVEEFSVDGYLVGNELGFVVIGRIEGLRVAAKVVGLESGISPVDSLTVVEGDGNPPSELDPPHITIELGESTFVDAMGLADDRIID